jgi:hypothetical protein
MLFRASDVAKAIFFCSFSESTSFHGVEPLLDGVVGAPNVLLSIAELDGDSSTDLLEREGYSKVGFALGKGDGFFDTRIA